VIQLSNSEPLTAGDELLRWASEVGNGTWDSLKLAIGQLASKHSFKMKAWSFASMLSHLGHLDIDWKQNRWSIAKPTLNLIPGLGLCMVLTGSRPFYFQELFEEAAESLSVYAEPFEQKRKENYQDKILGPKAIFAKCGSVEDAEEFAKRIKAPLNLDPGKNLLALLASVETPIQPAAPPFNNECKFFDPNKLEWRNAQQPLKPGLYKVESYRISHLWFDGESWSHIEPSLGQLKAIKQTDNVVLEWSPAKYSDGNHSIASRLEVAEAVFLPNLVERALTVHSGFLPRYYQSLSSGRSVRRYLNVPVETAQILGVILDTKISYPATDE